MKHLEMMAKLKTLLTEARDAAGTEAKAAVQKLDEALKLLEESHQKMHEQMKRHMQMRHKGMMSEGEGRMLDMKCPMCGQRLGPEPMVVNSVCPMTGKTIDPYNVPHGLTREFRGKKIGFCCPSYPPAWDKLSDQEKQDKLNAAMKSSEKPS